MWLGIEFPCFGVWAVFQQIVVGADFFTLESLTDFLKEEEYDEDNEYGITLVSLDEKYRKENEPGAAPIHERISSLKALHDRGCKTWISIEPYPTPNIKDQDLNEILQAVKFTDRIVFGRTNYNKRVSEYPNYRQFYNEKARQVIEFCQKNNIQSYIKKKTMTEE